MIGELIHSLAAKPFGVAAAVIGLLAGVLWIYFPPSAPQFAEDGSQHIPLLSRPPGTERRVTVYNQLSPWVPRLLIISFLCQIGSIATGE